jgi:hypothetical protein
MTLGLWGSFFALQIGRSFGGYLWFFVCPFFYKRLVSILVKTNFGWFFKTRIDISWFYIRFNINLIGEYQKLKEPKVLGTFGGEQLIENLEVFQNSW